MRVAIVASAVAVRASLEAIVRASDSATVATTAASVDTVLADPQLASCDVILLHAGVTEAGVARQLAALPPIPVVALLPGWARPQAINAALSAGARGVLSDDASADEVLAALGAAVAGLAVFPPELVAEVLSVRPAASESAAFPPAGARSPARAVALTPREHEILAMLAEGLPNKIIASRLRISEHTVKTHLEAIFDKLGASTRAEAVARAVRQGLLLL